jgi:hypothetical protein
LYINISKVVGTDSLEDNSVVVVGHRTWVNND